MVDLISRFAVYVKHCISSKIYKKAFNIRFMEGDDPVYLYADPPSQDKLRKSFKLFLIAAKLGHDRAQREVARMYLRGYGVSINHVFFEYWAILAYEQGNAMALFDLADFHRNAPKRMHIGEDGKYFSNVNLAYDEYEVLAKSGYGEAQEILGDMYRIGEGGREPDREKSLYWYEIAASNGMWEAGEMLEFMKENQDVINK